MKKRGAVERLAERFREGDVIGHEDGCGCALLLTSEHSGVAIELCARAVAAGTLLGDEFPPGWHNLLYRVQSKRVPARKERRR